MQIGPGRPLVNQLVNQVVNQLVNQRGGNMVSCSGSQNPSESDSSSSDLLIPESKLFDVWISEISSCVSAGWLTSPAAASLIRWPEE